MSKPTYTVSLTFEGVSAENPLEAAKQIVAWLQDKEGGAEDMTYDVKNEVSGEAFTVDLSEEDEDAVLPNKEADTVYKDTHGEPLEVGDSVEVPDPNGSDDAWQHSFVGTIKKFENGYAVVEDGEGDCFSVEPNRLEFEDN